MAMSRISPPPRPHSIESPMKPMGSSLRSLATRAPEMPPTATEARSSQAGRETATAVLAVEKSENMATPKGCASVSGQS